ncbi:unnamed protein product [Bemisia tabaci]|uniref:Uncharacterized protein n=1 Tax=Bemisia tabaci TaxID=7038 RepID=A0A9P0C5P9_BEMTA|nr:unnamed protein product [Bemisia tabaci]
MNKAYERIALKPKISRSFDGGKVCENIKGDEMSEANRKNPRPIHRLNQFIYARNSGAPGTRGLKNSMTMAGGGSSNSGPKTPESLLSRPLYGSYAQKQATESRPQITNMTSSGLMNAIKSAPRDQTFYQAKRTALNRGSPVKSRIQPPNYSFREQHSNFSEPNPSFSIDNQRKSSEANQTPGRAFGGSPMGPISSMPCAESDERHPGNGGYREYEEGAWLRNSNSSISSFGSAAGKEKQYYDSPLRRRPIKDCADGDHLQERNASTKEATSVLKSRTRFQNLKIIVVVAYELAKTVALFMLVTAVLWSGSAIMFDVVPFPATLRNSLKEMISYKKPEPRHPMLYFTGKLFRILRKIPGFCEAV